MDRGGHESERGRPPEPDPVAIGRVVGAAPAPVGPPSGRCVAPETGSKKPRARVYGVIDSSHAMPS